MTNNDVLRRIRYIYDYGDAKMIAIFKSGEYAVTRETLSNLLKKDDDEHFELCMDIELAHFLNGFINEHRGKQEGKKPIVEEKLTKNIIMRKLKIALNYTDIDILETLALQEFTISKHELSAFFRKPEHKHYRVMKNQVLRLFLRGLQTKILKK